jgi:hypothetical protein
MRIVTVALFGALALGPAGCNNTPTPGDGKPADHKGSGGGSKLAEQVVGT